MYPNMSDEQADLIVLRRRRRSGTGVERPNEYNFILHSAPSALAISNIQHCYQLSMHPPHSCISRYSCLFHLPRSEARVTSDSRSRTKAENDQSGNDFAANGLMESPTFNLACQLKDDCCLL